MTSGSRYDSAALQLKVTVADAGEAPMLPPESSTFDVMLIDTFMP
jgi:hypothetical protein